jgi:N-hydroxyarylamine O-acetyltransferase
MEIESYFDRIGYRGPRTVNLETLNAVVRNHVQAIPFENLSVLLGEPISLFIDDVTQKIVHERRGGYCFEHNTLLLHVLSELGFSITALSARSRYQVPERFGLPRTHMCLRVELDGQSYLVDGGFGALSPTCALTLTPNVEQSTPHEPRRLTLEGQWEGLSLRGPDAGIVHQAKLGDTWHTLYEFTLEPMPPIDREMGNWYTSKHPSSHFKSKLMAARATRDGRIALLNRELTHRKPNGSSETRQLETHDELLEILAHEFDISLAPGTRISCSGLADLA